MLAITFHVDVALAGLSAVPLASFAGSLGALGDRLRAGDGAPARPVDDRAAAGRRHDDRRSVRRSILFTQYLADFTETFRTVRWLMGTLDVGGYAPIVAALPMLVVAVRAARDAAARARSHQPRHRRGRGARRQRRSRRAARARQRVAGDRRRRVAGGPGRFVGLVVPHLVRLLVGSDHRLVLPASALFGAAFLIVCDAGRANVCSRRCELPVGIVTALIGGPFFLWLLVRK